MRQLLPLTFCLLANLSASAQATEAPPAVQLSLTQWVSQACQNDTLSENSAITTVASTQIAAPGACITYRLEVVNSGGQIARNVTVSAPIPVHTRLYRPLRQVTGMTAQTQAIRIIRIEPQMDGQQVLQAVLAELPAGEVHRVSLEYVVQVL